MSVSLQDILEAMDGIALLIDRDLIVRRVGRRHWDQFWSRNGGLPTDVGIIGRDITASFSEGEVRDTYHKLFIEMLEGKRGLVRIAYRCDAPTLRRSMRLAVTPVETDTARQYLLYQSSILSVEQRPAIPLFGATVVGLPGPGVLRICSICAKVAWPTAGDPGNDEWIEPQDYYRRGGADVALLSHGFCAPCAIVIQAEDE